MPRVKENTKIKKGRTAAEKRIEGGVEETVVIIPLKGKKILTLEEPEAILGVEEKAVVEEDVVLPAAEDEEAAEEAALDDEELNPFGDKWEE